MDYAKLTAQARQATSNVLFVEKLQDAENPGLYVGGFWESSVLTHKRNSK